MHKLEGVEEELPDKFPSGQPYRSPPGRDNSPISGARGKNPSLPGDGKKGVGPVTPGRVCPAHPSPLSLSLCVAELRFPSPRLAYCVLLVVLFFFSASRSLVDSERGLLRHRFMAARTGLNVP